MTGMGRGMQRGAWRRRGRWSSFPAAVVAAASGGGDDGGG